MGLEVTMIGNLYRCTATHRIYVITEMDDNGFITLECTCEPYDIASMHLSNAIGWAYIPITTEKQ